MLARHSQILDRHDPKGEVGISFSEWGAWWATDKNRPSNLFQANTLRDAVIAGLTLNIFHNHAARVQMANIAQMANVLQSLVLTDKDRLLLTPTYHVFDLYQGHQGATLLPVEVAGPDYTLQGVRRALAQRQRFPRRQWRLDAVRGQRGPVRAAKIEIGTVGREIRTAPGGVITADSMDARPEFGKADPLRPAQLGRLAVRRGVTAVVAPAKSVVVLTLSP